MYLLVFIHIGSRRVWVSSATAHLNSAWLTRQARNVCIEYAEEKQKPSYIIHDADTKFTTQFDEIFESEGIKIKKLFSATPIMNCYAEKLIQSAQQ